MRSGRQPLVFLMGRGALGPALAPSCPERTLKLIVPQPPGGGFDRVARVLADRALAAHADADLPVFGGNLKGVPLAAAFAIGFTSKKLTTPPLP